MFNPIWLLPIVAGVLNGTAWALPKFYARTPPLLFTGVGFLVASLTSAVWLLYTGLPEITPTFWFATGINALLLAVAFTLAVAAPRISDLTLTRPINAFTPVLMLVSGPALIAGGVDEPWQQPNVFGVLGVVVMVGAVYQLFRTKDGGMLGPLRAIGRERGAWLMLVVVALYSVTSYLDLIALRAANWALYLTVVFALIGCFSLCLAYLDSTVRLSITEGWYIRFVRIHFVRIRFVRTQADEQGLFGGTRTAYQLSHWWCEWKIIVLFGLLYAFATICHMVAIDMTEHVTYVVAIKEGITAVDSMVAVWFWVAWHTRRKQGVDQKLVNERTQLRRRAPWLLVLAGGVVMLLTLGVH